MGRGSRKGNERRQVEGKRERVRDSSTGEAQRWWWCGKERTKKKPVRDSTCKSRSTQNTNPKKKPSSCHVFLVFSFSSSFLFNINALPRGPSYEMEQYKQVQVAAVKTGPTIT